MRLVTRAQWGARSARHALTPLLSARGVKVHYVGSRVEPSPATACGAHCRDMVRGIQAHHIDGNGWSDIAYNLLVCEHGAVFEGRGKGILSAANGAGLNQGHYAVCALLGDKGLVEPSDAMLDGLVDAIGYLRNHGAGPEIKGHRDGYSTSCVPLDSTDVLTRRGWMPLGDVRADDEVASWALDSGLLTFDRPAAIVEPYEATTMVIDGFETTPDHNWVTYGQKAWAVGCSCGYQEAPASIRSHVREGRRRREVHETVFEERWKLVRADEIGQSFIYPRAVPGSGAGLRFTDDEIRLMVWFQGDGHVMEEPRSPGSPPYGVEWHLRKPRKVERLAGLLRSLNIEYRHNVKSDGTVSLRVYGDVARERIIALLPDKRFHWGLLDLSPHQAEVFLEELMHVDGCQAGSYFCSAESVNLDVVQAVASINGRAAVLDDRVVRLRAGRERSQWRGRASRFAGGRTTLVGCLTTVNGTLVIRQSGRVLIVGNCPGEALYAWVRAGAPRPDGGDTSSPLTTWTETLVDQLPLLNPGDTGRHAKSCFYLLRARGYGKTLDEKVVDPNTYGPSVLEEVKRFQADKGLEPDGLVGKATWPRLLGL